MNLLYIIIPFFFYSFFTKLITDNYSKKFNYDKLLSICLALSCVICYFVDCFSTLILTTFATGLIISYLQNSTEKKWLEYSFEVIFWIIVVYFLFLLEFSPEKITISITFLSFIYFMLGKYKNDIPFSVSQILPLGFAGLYLHGESPVFPILFMTLFGTIRFFIEKKTEKESKLISQSFTLILLTLIATFDNINFKNNIFILFAGSTFLIMDYISIYVLKNKNNLIKRLDNLSLMRASAIIKSALFNIIAISIIALSVNDYLSIYIALGLIISLALSLYIKIWYNENEYR